MKIELYAQKLNRTTGYMEPLDRLGETKCWDLFTRKREYIPEQTINVIFCPVGNGGATGLVERLI